jgi:hypothetical protein
MRLFPSWFRWALSALVSTCIGFLTLNAIGFSDGEWVTSGRWGPHFKGGDDVILLIVSAIVAYYSWLQILRMLAEKVKKRVK